MVKGRETPMRVMKEFKDLLREVKKERLIRGKESFEKSPSYTRLTLTIAKLFNYKPELKEMLIEASIEK